MESILINFIYLPQKNLINFSFTPKPKTQMYSLLATQGLLIRSNNDVY